MRQCYTATATGTDETRTFVLSSTDLCNVTIGAFVAIKQAELES